jgi:formyl-CoA transferase
VKVLDGVKVLELGTTLTAPYCGMLLGDLGADVVKVENPAGGDPFRSWRGSLYSAHFCAFNKNKRSIVLDLRSDDGRNTLLELVDHADVVLENFRPDVMERLDLGWDVLHARNPRLIHCSITGFGSFGPSRGRPAFDTVSTALSGILSLWLDRDDPDLVGTTIGDNVGGLFACYGILGALYERQRTGVGRRVEVAMIEAVMAFSPHAFASYTANGIVPDRLSGPSGSQAFTFRCADGKSVAVHLSSRDKFWDGLMRAFECPEIASDPRYVNRSKRIENYLALRADLKAIAATRPRAHWIARLEEQDVPYAPLHPVDEVLDDPQVRALGTFYRTQHPTEGEITSVRRPVFIDGSRVVDDRPPPTLGEHNAEVLAEGSPWRAPLQTIR